MLGALAMALATAAPSELCGSDPVGAVEAALEGVNQAWAALDQTAFDRSAKQVEAAVACLDEVPPGSTVARLHRGMALIAFVNGQKTASRRAMVAARLADPTWKLTEDLFPEGHPYHGIYADAADAGPVAPIGEIAPRVWVVDGVPREEAPTERAFLLQVQAPAGIELTEYLYDAEEIPDLGQDSTVPPWATPRKVAFGAWGAVRFLSSVQEVRGPGVQAQDDAALGAGGIVGVRYTPIAFLGAEAVAASLGGADPLLGGTFGPEAHAVGLFGAGTRVGAQQVYGNARLGYARDTVVSWTASASGPVQLFSALDGAVVGLEGGARGDRLDLRLAGDAVLAGSRGLYELRAGAFGTLGLTGPVALDLGLTARSGSMNLEGAGDATIAVRADTELRFQVGPTLWFD